MMDLNSRRMSHQLPQSTADNLPVDDPVHSVCSLCQKILSPETEATDDLDNICGDCKFLLLEDLDTPSRERHRRRPPTQRRTRYSSSESTENLFSQQFSHMINLVRQNQHTVSGLDDPPVETDQANRLVQQTSTRTTPNGSSRWRRVLSDTESDGFDNVDSVYAESESIFSFGRGRTFQGESDAVSYSTFGGDSDASVDLNGFLDPNGGSDYETDTDIDPMHTGINHWNSDDQEEDSEWVEVDEADEDGVRVTNNRARVHVQSFLIPSRNEQGSRSPESVDLMRSRSIFASLEEPVWVSDIGDPADDLEGRGLDDFLQHLLEDSLRRGAPPASMSFVNGLPRVSINKGHLKHDGLSCAICKDSLTIGTEVNQLPCDHLYHPHCIFPWLTSRNSCPLCRYELPTDDKEYEEGKRRHSRGTENRDAHPIANEDSSVTFSDREDDDGEEYRAFIEHRTGQREAQPSEESVGNSNLERDNRRGRWLFYAAAPIVGLVGIVLVLWLGNLRTERRGSAGPTMLQIPGPHHVQSTESSSGRRESRSRRWWPFF